MTDPPKPVVGLVGGIGAGKSAVAAALAARGGFVIDADKVGHAVLEQPDVTAALVGRWGERVRRGDGRPDRRAVAAVVFAHPAERTALERLVFPRIEAEVAAQVAAARADPGVRFVALDAAVLLEAGWAGRVDKLVFVDAPDDTRAARVAARSGWSAADLAAREAAQWPLADKKARADAVVTNDGSPGDLQRRVDDLLARWGLLAAADTVHAEPTRGSGADRPARGS